MFSTGTTSSGASGSISIGTGLTTNGESGGIYINVGTTTTDDKGGDIDVEGGTTLMVIKMVVPLLFKLEIQMAQQQAMADITINIYAGYSASKTGGTISMASGYGKKVVKWYNINQDIKCRYNRCKW